MPEQEKHKKLSELKPGEKGKIIKIIGKGDVMRRIIEIGIHPGKEILVERVAPLGDPVEFKLDGFHVSLRKAEANNILVETLI